jgi:GxxExxY protein
MAELSYSQLTEGITAIGVRVHSILGPGLEDKVYKKAVRIELKKSGIKFKANADIPILYERKVLGWDRVDFIVDKKVLIMVVAAEEDKESQSAQKLMASRLRGAQMKVGFVLNFAKNRPEIRRISV